MMNVLTDILCDTSSLMAPQNFKVSLPQNKISQHDISSKQQPLFLDSVSQMSNINRSLSSVNHSSPSNINIFNSSDQIHIPSNMDSGFEERNSVSVFSDSFPEIVPSWLAHDFMKVSDNLASPGILSNVSDIYSSNRENEHLEMLDLGFTPELSSQDIVANNINRSCINDSQKILDNIPLQRFSNSESLIIPSFNDINNTHLHISMNKNGMQYQKFKQNGPDVNSTQSLMNAVLPCENELLHLPLPTSLNEQCLNSTSSPSIISSSQSQSHPVDVVCDKLPQINLNHLDSLLGNETTLPEIQLLRHDFSGVRLNEDGCSSHSNRACLNSYNPNGSMIPCDTTNILGTNVSSLPQSQDVSVQVCLSEVTEQEMLYNTNCFSCNKIPLDSPIEVAQCFKCKFCDYVSIHKCAVANHINISHSKPPDSTNINNSVPIDIRSDSLNSLSVGGLNETHFNSTNSIISSDTNTNTTTFISEGNIVKNDKFPCIQCNIIFSNISEFNLHLLSNHNDKPNHIQLNTTNTSVAYQVIPINSIVLNTPSNKDEGNFLVHSVSNIPQTVGSKTSKRKIYPKKVAPAPDKETAVTNKEKKPVSSHKKAWQNKMKRELGSYICEFKRCNVRFRALDNLEYHKKCHIMNSRAFQCPECEMNFDNWGAIAGHLWRSHGNDMELHACDQCSFKTYRLNRLENLHKRIHGKECPFLCDTCGKGFKNGKQLRNHRVIHTKATKSIATSRDTKCNICLKCFASKYLLRLHQKNAHNHNKVKPFVCNYCDYSASKKNSMDLHMRQHTGEKPFKCDSCDYRTSDHNSLRKHKMRHSGEKKYKCPYCSYSCIQSQVFKEHLKKHPGGNELVFSCNICKFKTLKQDIYLTHIDKHEQSNKPPGESLVNEMQLTDEIFPLAKAIDVSLSQTNNLFPDINKSKNIQSFYNGLNINMVSVGEQSAN